MNKFLHTIAKLGSIGHVPASGTVATMLTLLPVYALSGDLVAYVLVIGIVGVLSIPAIASVQDQMRTHDPSCIVIDEVIGCLITFIALPFSWWVLLLGFLLFRALDIFKPWPIRSVERLSGPWGVLFDDCMAGALSALILHVLHYYL